MFNKTLVIGILILSIGMSIIPSTVGTKIEKTSLIVSNYPGYIQDLIDNASDGDTIYIPSGTYYENIEIDKSISLIGEDKNITIIDGGEISNVVNISADWVNISGFTIKNSNKEFPYDWAGIKINSNNISINNNIIKNNCRGIYLGFSCSNIITRNSISNEWNNIYIDISYNNTIIGNKISNASYGIRLIASDNNNIRNNIISNNNWAGILLCYSSSNNITGNKISNNYYGIKFYDKSRFNTVKGNIISNNDNGIFLGDIIVPTLPIDISLDSSNFNIFIENNFFNNFRHADFDGCWTNIWNQNYWGRTRILPKLIFGYIMIIPWINVDWHPAKEPYDI